ncbi:hypothetical protein B0H13DRAFT_38315 [Mycena leptocephala]|nr:hypothetical protein B0H13DRAFT_38315 [Mycena leptocephala]
MGSANSTLQDSAPVSVRALVLFLHLVFYQSSLQFSQDLVDTLADNARVPLPVPRPPKLDRCPNPRPESRQSWSTSAPRSRPADQIHAALEKENLDRERAMAGDPGSVKTSPALLADLEEVRAKVDRFHPAKIFRLPRPPRGQRRLGRMYKNNTTTPLNCGSRSTSSSFRCSDRKSLQ